MGLEKPENVETDPEAEPSSETDDWFELRERVLARDNRKCRFCGMSEEEHKEENSASLDIHHIIPREDGGEDQLSNLVALCRSCHRTMEDLHSHAVGQKFQTEDYSDDLRNVSQTFRTYYDKEERYEDALWNFAKSNPVFSREFGIYNEHSESSTPHVYSWSLSEYATEPDEGITSEWEFVAKYGYLQALIDVRTTLDTKTSFPLRSLEENDSE